jgi:DNA (cytosine-5)-methyltransferase 1
VNKVFTFIDLFAGIGGFRIAFERLGCLCKFSSEWDTACQQIYELNFGERPQGDIHSIPSESIPDHDILTGGFPCQPFSIIGDMQGFEDTRGTLFFEIERILRDKKPEAFFLENVKQLVSHDKKRTFAVILDHLKGLGYFVHWTILNGLDFGVPQKRERVIIIGFKKNYPFKFPMKYDGPQLTLTDILEPEESIDKSYFASQYIQDKFLRRAKRILEPPTIWHENKAGNIGIHRFSCALRAGASYNYLLVNGKRRLLSREMLRLQGFPDSYKITGSHSQIRKQAGNSVVVPLIESVAREMLSAMEKSPIEHVHQTSFYRVLEEV